MLCANCEYDLTGLAPASPCPECGGHARVSDLRALRMRRNTRRAGVAVGVLVGISMFMPHSWFDGAPLKAVLVLLSGAHLILCIAYVRAYIQIRFRWLEVVVGAFAWVLSLPGIFGFLLFWRMLIGPFIP